MKVQAVGLFWFRDAIQYHELKNIFTDADVLSDSYTEWKHDAEKLIKRVERSGQRVIKVEADTSSRYGCNDRCSFAWQHWFNTLS